jgi:hypothetical protein
MSRIQTNKFMPERNSPEDIQALSEAIAKFERELPGWWWSIGHCSVSAHASAAPDGRWQDAFLLECRIFDRGFHYDRDDRDDDRPPVACAEALLNVLEQGKAARSKYVALSVSDRAKFCIEVERSYRAGL